VRALRLAILPLLVATSLAAQSPTSSPKSTPGAVVAPSRTAFLDFAALVSGRQRLGIEPLVFGRWTVGLIGGHYSTGSPTLLPTVAGWGSGYIAWSLDLAVRYYPAALSFDDPRRRLMVYVGEFVGYQWRTIARALYPPDILCAAPACSSGVVDNQHLTGWEPGAEVGVRLRPLEPVFVDVGGWFKIVGVDDPTQRIRPGHLDSRLVVALGIGW